MAEIYLARGAGGAGVERYCVLKRVLRSRAHDAQVVRMFLDEARLGAQLQHPNIASVYDLGTFADSYFFTMEYVHGETVRTVVHRAQALGRTLPLSCVLTIIAGAASGLHHAHERTAGDGRPLGIVHRDVSPSNLMVGYEGHVKLVDFGVAKAANRGVETDIGTIKGKIAYLSPEQSRGEPVDRRSDLFSLGIVMWEMLTGARLYRRTSDFATMTAIVHELPPAPSSYRPELPPAIDALVLRLLAKRVTDRFQDAAELVEAIEDAALRTSTVLSGTALRRLAGELFGARLEPWLELDRAPRHHRSVTLVTRSLPGAVDVTLEAPVEAELASVPDLSPARSAGEPTASVSRSEPHDAVIALGHGDEPCAWSPAGAPARPTAEATRTRTADAVAPPAGPPGATAPGCPRGPRGSLRRAVLAVAATLAAAWLTEHAYQAPAAPGRDAPPPPVIATPERASLALDTPPSLALDAPAASPAPRDPPGTPPRDAHAPRETRARQPADPAAPRNPPAHLEPSACTFAERGRTSQPAARVSVTNPRGPGAPSTHAPRPQDPPAIQPSRAQMIAVAGAELR